MKIAVFCSSSDNIAEDYRQVARSLGSLLAQKGHELIYGGTPCGLMGDVAQAAANLHAEVIGVIPDNWKDSEWVNPCNTQNIFVQNLAERKQLMSQMADAFVVLPGGIGTLDEAFSLMAMHQIGETTKKVYFINTNGFFSGIEQQLNHCLKENCMTMNSMSAYQFIDNPLQLPL